jgi:ubiquinone/menaquinone biosynthesis C-methylase UbiE
VKGVAVAGVAGSVVLVTAAIVGRDRWRAAQANIRRYSMPGPLSYDVVAGLFFRGRYRAIAETIAIEVPAGSRLLDVGCGPGEVLVRLAAIAPALDTTGLDVDAAMIERARAKAERSRGGASAVPQFVVADVASMPFPDASFDIVISSYAVHHWPDRSAGLAEIMRVLKPGGRAIVWDVAPPHPTGPSVGHGHGAHGDTGATAAANVPAPSLLGTLRMLLLFRRLPAQRYDFAKPAV